MSRDCLSPNTFIRIDTGWSNCSKTKHPWMFRFFLLIESFILGINGGGMVILITVFYSWCGPHRCQRLRLGCFSYQPWLKCEEKKKQLTASHSAWFFYFFKKREHFTNIQSLLRLCTRIKWPQIPSTGSGRASGFTTTRRSGRRSEGQAQCAAFTSWTPGLQAPPTSGSTGGGKKIFFCCCFYWWEILASV